MSVNWEKLRNGTDIRGVALEGIEGEKVNLTEEVANIIGASFGTWLSKKVNKQLEGLAVAIGTDSRISAPALKRSVLEGLTNLGCRVYDCGMASTPAMFMTTVLEEYKLDGAIMITASHLPFNRNGFKFFTMEGGVEKEDIIDILSIAEKNEFMKGSNKGEVISIDFISVYGEILVEKIREEVNDPVDKSKPLRDFKIIVDAGNGAGGFFVDKVLKPLGANTEGSQFIEPDGMFPNHIPNPEDKNAMAAIKNAVLDSQADLGIIFDTDVDRAAVVDSKGKEINRNSLIALISAIILEEYPNSIVVTDSITSKGLKKFIEEKLGGVHHRFKRGYKNVINEALRLNNEGKESYLAIETSGHAALKENYFLDDGAYLIAKILIKMAKLKLEENKSLNSLIEELEEPLESVEFRMNIRSEDFKLYGNEVIESLKEYAKTKEGWRVVPNNFEGIRIDVNEKLGNGWFLLRLSLHDPLMPLNIESDSRGGVEKILSDLSQLLNKYEKLDTSSINSFKMEKE